MPVSEAPLQLCMLTLFEAWWKKDLKEKEEFGRTAFLISLKKSFALKKPVSIWPQLYVSHLSIFCSSYKVMFSSLICVIRVLRSKESGISMMCFWVWTTHQTTTSRLQICYSSAFTILFSLEMMTWVEGNSVFVIWSFCHSCGFGHDLSVQWCFYLLQGKRFLVFLFSWNINFIWVIHGTIKNQLEFYSK